MPVEQVLKSSCNVLAMTAESKLKQNLLPDAVLEEASLGADKDHFSCEALHLMQSRQGISYGLFTTPRAVVACCVYHIPAPVAK